MPPEFATPPIARERPRRSPVRVVLALLLVYMGLSFAGAVAFMGKEALRRPWPETAVAADLAPRAREVAFTSADGYHLSGLLAPPVGEAPILILQHGRGRNRDSYLPWARVFAEAGYGVLSFDWRAHGSSEGRIIQHGAGEPEDLLAALALLEGLPETRGRPVAVFGASLGAACVAMSGGRLPPQVRCMVLDSPYGDLGRMVAQRLERLGVLAVGPRLALDLLARLLFGRAASDIVPERELQGFAPRPVLVIHGAHDATIPVQEGRSLAAAYPGPVQYWELTEPGHCAGRSQQTREWMRRLSVFFAEHLPGAPEVGAVMARTPERLEASMAARGQR